MVEEVEKVKLEGQVELMGVLEEVEEMKDKVVEEALEVEKEEEWCLKRRRCSRRVRWRRQ